MPPYVGLDVREFVEHDEIDAVATAGTGFKDAADNDLGAVEEVDAHLRFIGTFGPERFGLVFDAFPEDAAALVDTRAEVPDALICPTGGAEDFGKG